MSRSSHLQRFCKIGVLKSFAKLTRKHLCMSLFFNKVADFQPATLRTRNFGTVMWFLRNFQKHRFFFFFFFFFQKISGQLLLFVTDRCNTFTDVSEQVASELWKYFVKNTYGIINAYNSKIQKRKKLFHRKWENYIFQFACVSHKKPITTKK